MEGEDTPRQYNLRNQDISDIMQGAVAGQYPYGSIFAFVGGARLIRWVKQKRCKTLLNKKEIAEESNRRATTMHNLYV